MDGSLTIGPMPDDFVLWRCLHGGPLDAGNVDHPKPHPSVPWERVRARNVPLLRALAAAYGAIAIVARAGDRVVGQLRFWPRAVTRTPGAGGMCVQQLPPAGPDEGFRRDGFPPVTALDDKALVLGCMIVAKEYRRRRIGPALIEGLVQWARENGWEGIHAQAIGHIPPLLHWTGQPSVEHLRRAGFVVEGEAVHPELKEGVVSQRAGAHGDAVRAMWEPFAALSDDEAAVMYEMSLDLRSGAGWALSRPCEAQ